MPAKKNKKQKEAEDQDHDQDGNNNDVPKAKSAAKGRKKAGKKTAAAGKKGKSLAKGGVTSTGRATSKPSSDDDYSDEVAEEANPKKKTRTDHETQAEPEKDTEKETEKDASDAESHSSIPPATKNVKKMKAKPVQLPAEVEESLVDWYEEHGTLYNKSKPEFRDKAKKAQLYVEKAAELRASGIAGVEDITAEMLKRWFTGQRTMYGKEKEKFKSGDGQTMLSARRKERIAKWAFIECHIVPKRRRQQFGVRKHFLINIALFMLIL